jgi:hypothetical protein
MSAKRGRPTLVDELALGPARDADAPEEPPAAEGAAEAGADDPDPLAPSPRQTLAGAIEEPAQAPDALRARRPDPAAGWEAFAASRPEFDPQAAVGVEPLHTAYLRWRAGRGRRGGRPRGWPGSRPGPSPAVPGR